MSLNYRLLLASTLGLLLAIIAFYKRPSALENNEKNSNSPSRSEQQSQCVSPPLPHSCDFYSSCLESHFNCGSQGYPLAYGDHYCRKFSSPENLNNFTTAGQTWMWDTMYCLQSSLVPMLKEKPNDDSCKGLEEKAFGTHASCYISSGLCRLPVTDWVTIVKIVGLGTLFNSLDAFEQSIQAAEGCAEFYVWSFGGDNTGPTIS